MVSCNPQQRLNGGFDLEYGFAIGTDIFMRSAQLIAVQTAAITRNRSIFLVSFFLTECSAIL